MRKRNFILFVILNLFVLIVTASSCGASNNAPGGTNSDMNDGMYAPGYNGGSNVEDSFIGDINNEEYNKVTENPFYNTTYQQSSFFSMDSFTASYSNLRRYINSNMALNGDGHIKIANFLNDNGILCRKEVQRRKKYKLSMDPL